MRPAGGGVLIAAGDQGIKALVAQALPAGDSVPVIPGVLSLTHVQNTGVAFGLFAGLSPAITALAVLTLFVALFYNRGRWLELPILGVGVALMAGGAAGNLIDRVRLGFVVDYLDLHIWPVFNLADVAIVIGATLLAVGLARGGHVWDSRR